MRKLDKRFAMALSVGVLIGPVFRITAAQPADSPKAPQKPAHPQIEYSVEQDDSAPGSTALHATANGKTYELISKSRKMWLQVVDQRDFDGNGSIDALVINISGGNCCPNQFFFVSALGDGRFEVGEVFDESRMTDPVIERWKGRWSVVVTSDNEGYNLNRPLEITRRFILEAGKAVRVEEWRRKDLESIVEMRSEIFDMNKTEETHSFEYDLDGDGKKDRITGRLWERWGRILWSIQFANGKNFSSEIACKRIGVLATQTNGVNDLVCDQDRVLRWNSLEYR